MAGGDYEVYKKCMLARGMEPLSYKDKMNEWDKYFEENMPQGETILQKFIGSDVCWDPDFYTNPVRLEKFHKLMNPPKKES